MNIHKHVQVNISVFQLLLHKYCEFTFIAKINWLHFLYKIYSEMQTLKQMQPVS